MARITLRDLRRYLKERSHEELVADLADLYRRFDRVQAYYQARLTDEGDRDLVVKYKQAIEREFFPTRGGYGPARLSQARRAISEYKQLSPSVAGLIDLMLYYVETGGRYTNTYGDIDEAFYTSMEKMYARAVDLIVKHQLREHVIPRCRQIVTTTAGIGWGFHDQLAAIYEEGFGVPAT